MARKKRKFSELNALKGLIREKNTSYRRISEEMGISLGAFNDKVNGFYALTCPEMEKIAEILDIDPRDLSKYFLPTYCKTQRISA